MNVIDLFCGCGGLSYGFIMSGYNILVGIDNDPTAIKTYLLNHNNANALTGDLSDGKILRKVEKLLGPNCPDVVIGGPPCQGFSLSGPRNLRDPRNKLYLSFFTFVKHFFPKAFLIENVPGILSLYDGRIKDDITDEFGKLGYVVSIQPLVAADYGIPQLRKRAFFIGLRGRKFKFPAPKMIMKSYISCEEAINDLPALENGIGTEVQLYPDVKRTKYQQLMRGKSQFIYNHIGTNHSEQTTKIIGMVPEGGNYKNLPLKYQKIRNFHVAFTRYHSKQPASTIDTGHRHHFHYKYNRVLTVRENARLQSFPDSFIFLGNKTEQQRQVGNAVPPLLAKCLADELKTYIF
jgi:DNA (cytosine-5)-methyltransferase 1